jgi:hypothetical protein
MWTWFKLFLEDRYSLETNLYTYCIITADIMRPKIMNQVDKTPGRKTHLHVHSAAKVKRSNSVAIRIGN